MSPGLQKHDFCRKTNKTCKLRHKKTANYLAPVEGIEICNTTPTKDAVL
jgi:hypothetical protein